MATITLQEAAKIKSKEFSLAADKFDKFRKKHGDTILSFNVNSGGPMAEIIINNNIVYRRNRNNVRMKKELTELEKETIELLLPFTYL